MSIKVDVSVGEFLDKLSILQIKSERIIDQDKLKNISNELSALQQVWLESEFSNSNLTQELLDLRQVNEALWDIEDAIREKERLKQYDEKFTELARSVYVTNDKRAEVKKRINQKTGSELTEEKSYAEY